MAHGRIFVLRARLFFEAAIAHAVCDRSTICLPIFLFLSLSLCLSVCVCVELSDKLFMTESVVVTTTTNSLKDLKYLVPLLCNFCVEVCVSCAQKFSGTRDEYYFDFAVV